MPGFTTRPEIRGTLGMVASTHCIASAVGMSVLEKGGNAFDAAAAAGFTLQVVEPHLNGPLGEAAIERAFRDVHAITQHIGVHPRILESTGRVLFGLEPNTPLF